MNRILLRLRRSLRNERGEITFFACFFVVGVVMLISFLLLYASIRINCINIRKMCIRDRPTAMPNKNETAPEGIIVSDKDSILS